MALQTIQLTLGAGATQLTSAANRVAIRQALFGAAAHTYYIGTSNVDATHGVPVPTTAAPVSLGPFSALPVNSDEIYLFGTQNDVIQVAIVN